MEGLRSKAAAFVVIVGVLAGGGITRADFVVCDPKPVDQAINSPNVTNPAGCSFLPDGLKLYFGQNRNPGGNPPRRDLWVTERESTDAPWGEAVNLGPNVNDSDSQGQPSISNDGLALFFTNHTTGRILMCVRATVDDDWDPAIDLGLAANGQDQHSFPEISPDGSILYFSLSLTWGVFRQVSIRPVVDFDDNGSVGMDDLLTMIGAWGTDGPLYDIGPMPWGDGVVDEADLEVVMERWEENTPIYTHTVVDDFESYTDTEPNVIWETWSDFFVNNTGAVIGYVRPPPNRAAQAWCASTTSNCIAHPGNSSHLILRIHLQQIRAGGAGNRQPFVHVVGCTSSDGFLISGM